MKRSKWMKKALSMVTATTLAFPGLFGLAPSSEVSAAEGGESFDSVVLELTQAAGLAGRVNLTYKGSPLNSLVKGPVIDEVSYDSSNSNLLAVNNQGNITLSSGYTFAAPGAPGIPVTVTATASYYQDSDVLFMEDFENNNGPMTSTGKLGSTFALTDAQSRSGLKAITPSGDTNNENVAQDVALPAGGNYKMTAWYFDPYPYEEKTATERTQFAIVDGKNATFAGTIYQSSEADVIHNPTKYTWAYAPSSAGTAGNRWKDSGIERSTGWHKFEWLITPDGARLQIDGTLIPESEQSSIYKAMKSGTTIQPKIAGGWNGQPGNKAYIKNKHLIDDFYVVKDVATTTGTRTLTVNVIPPGGLPNLEIITQPSAAKVNQGETATFSVTASAAAAAYQWYVSDDETGLNGAKVSGADQAVFTLSNVDSASQQGKFYYCEVSSAEGVVLKSQAVPLLITTHTPVNSPINPTLNPDTGIYTGASNYGDTLVTLFKDGEPVGYYLSKNGGPDQPNNHERHHILPYARAMGTGNYTVTAIVINNAGDISEEVAASGTLAIEKLPAPENLKWNGTYATWDRVANAAAYSVQLFSNGAANGSPIAATSNDAALSPTLNDTFKVTANGDATSRFLDSDESGESAQYSASIALIRQNDTLRAGDRTRLIVDTGDVFVADNISFSPADQDKDKIEVDNAGFVTVKKGFVPTGNEEVTVEVSVDYFNKANTLFYDGFEGEKKFSNGANGYVHSDVMSRTGAKAATTSGAGQVATVPGTYNYTPAAGKTTIVTAWYYDDGRGASNDHAVFGLTPSSNEHIAINYGNGDGDWAANLTNYAVRPGSTGRFYPVDVQRSEGWHKFQWFVTSTGTTYKIDGQDLQRQSTDGGNFDTPVKNNITKIDALQLATNWGNKPGTVKDMQNRHFIDDVYVVDSGITAQTGTASVTLKLLPKEYSHLEDSTYVIGLEDYNITVNPDLEDLAGVEIGAVALQRDVDYTISGNVLKIHKESFARNNIVPGKYTVRLDLNPAEITFELNIVPLEVRDYYFSNDGDDQADGRTPATAWKSISKINEYVFMPGSTIYLDANSVWNEQIRLRGNGQEGNPITLTKYNTTDPNQRPIINGGGTASSPSGISLNGTIELYDVNYWVVSGIEVTNIGNKAGDGRSGIAVMSRISKLGQGQFNIQDYADARMQGIVIRDNYVHDVNGLHQANGANKVSGGIIINGYVDILVEGNKTLRCDNEGIRNNAYGPSSPGTNNTGITWSNSSYPWASKAVFKNNWISGSVGDGIVLSGGNNSLVERNVVTDSGYSYLSDKSGNLVANWGPNNSTPTYLGTQNYAAAWIMASKGTIFRYNEAVDNPYHASNDGMAWDIDNYCQDNVYEYNYSRNNYGGWYLQMNAAKGNIVRYNISVNDGRSPDFNKSFNSLVLLAGGSSTSEESSGLYYNNVIVTPLKNSSSLIFDPTGSNLHIYFQNNIFAYTGANSQVGLKGGGTSAPFAAGRFTNNIVYPANLFGSMEAGGGGYLGAGVTAADNRYVTEEELNSILNDYKSAPEHWIANSGTVDAKLDYSAMNGFRLAEGNNPAYGAGAEIISPYVDRVNALPHMMERTDFFGNPLGGRTPSIGAHNPYAVTFDSNGGTEVMMKFADMGGTITEPTAPTKDNAVFGGWYQDAEFNDAWNFALDPVTRDMALFAKWVDDAGTGTAPTITTKSLADGKVGQPYSEALATDGDKPIKWAVVEGQLPLGLSLDEDAGVISGTPDQWGQFTFKVQATNEAGSDTKAFNIVITEEAPVDTAPEIITKHLPSGKVGQEYAVTLAVYGSEPMTWKVKDGDLPTDLNLDEATGLISGTPHEAGHYEFTVAATNDFGMDESVLRIEIIEDQPVDKAPEIITKNLPSGKVGQAYTATLAVYDNKPVTWTVSDRYLPAGLSLEGATGVISGVPIEAGTYKFTVAASNPEGMDTRALTIVITANNNGGNNGNNGNNNNGNGGNSGGQGSRPTPSPESPVADPMDAAIQEQLKKGDSIELTMPAGKEELEIQRDTIDAMIKAGKPLTVTNDTISVELSPELLKQLNTGKRMKVVIKPVDKGDGVIGRGYELKIFADGQEVTDYTGAIPVIFDLTKEKLSPNEISRLSGVLLRLDGNKERLGGNYDRETGKFTFTAKGLGYIYVTSKPEPVKLELTLGKTGYKLNGIDRSMDVSSMAVKGRTLVPLRFVAESLGANVGWDHVTKTVTITLDDQTLSFAIGELAPGMDVAAELVDGRTMLPLRFIAEYFGADVFYDSTTKSISIMK
ncbi:stalk domain-containing protein [Paenibacillus sp. FSL R5-0407]|uniref:putative Ig domain-containing protein n=1 Tax=Paenibacillus sp. FSL R5-0407 TaxID=2975320 RepID=UPI0030F7EF99